MSTNPRASTIGMLPCFYGCEYQVDNFIHACLKYSHQDFSICIEKTDFGEKFFLDDIVIKDEKNKFTFIQCKRVNSPLTFEKFFPSDKRNEKNFVIGNYFDSFKMIKNKSEFERQTIEHVMICTNVDISRDSCVFEFEEQKLPLFEGLNETENQSELFKDFGDVDIVQYRLNPVIVDYLKEQNSAIVKDDETKNEFKEFLTKFLLVVNVTELTLDYAMQKILKSTFSGSQYPNVKYIESFIKSKFRDWLKKVDTRERKYRKVDLDIIFEGIVKDFQADSDERQEVLKERKRNIDPEKMKNRKTVYWTFLGVWGPSKYVLSRDFWVI